MRVPHLGMDLQLCPKLSQVSEKPSLSKSSISGCMYLLLHLLCGHGCFDNLECIRLHSMFSVVLSLVAYCKATLPKRSTRMILHTNTVIILWWLYDQRGRRGCVILLLCELRGFLLDYFLLERSWLRRDVCGARRQRLHHRLRSVLWHLLDMERDGGVLVSL